MTRLGTCTDALTVPTLRAVLGMVQTDCMTRLTFQPNLTRPVGCDPMVLRIIEWDDKLSHAILVSVPELWLPFSPSISNGRRHFSQTKATNGFQ